MPRYRNVSNDELWVPALGQSVKPDEVVEVSDDDDLVWPETTWSLVGKSKS